MTQMHRVPVVPAPRVGVMINHTEPAWRKVFERDGYLPTIKKYGVGNLEDRPDEPGADFCVMQYPNSESWWEGMFGDWANHQLVPALEELIRTGKEVIVYLHLPVEYELAFTVHRALQIFVRPELSICWDMRQGVRERLGSWVADMIDEVREKHGYWNDSESDSFACRTYGEPRWDAADVEGWMDPVMYKSSGYAELLRTHFAGARPESPGLPEQIEIDDAAYVPGSDVAKACHAWAAVVRARGHSMVTSADKPVDCGVKCSTMKGNG